jgi:hypothetical protein
MERANAKVRVCVDYSDGVYSMTPGRDWGPRATILIPLAEWDDYVAFLRGYRAWQEHIRALDHAIYARAEGGK